MCRVINFPQVNSRFSDTIGHQLNLLKRVVLNSFKKCLPLRNEFSIFSFQRSTYGNGYYLTLVMNNGSDTSTSGTEEGEGKMSFTDSLKKKNPFNDLDDLHDGSDSTQQILNVASSPGFPTNSVVFAPYPFYP